MSFLIRSRRQFLRQFGLGAAAVFGSTLLLPSTAKAIELLDKIRTHKLTILHTNDTHSRIEPFPMDGGKYQGMGGVARRASLIEAVRKTEKNVLLLDAGDMFQGTPYFNLFKGEVEMKMMSQLGYDAATIGNHDFDAGIELLSEQIQNYANFPIINANYDFRNTPMRDLCKPYKVFEFKHLRVGVLGVGVGLEGLVPPAFYTYTKYLDPIERANHYANILRTEERCDYIICLSHLGHSYKNNQVSDLNLAAGSKEIDLIIGGHTHTFLEQPVMVQNQAGEAVAVAQVGWAGVWLGRIDVGIETTHKQKCLHCTPLPVGG